MDKYPKQDVIADIPWRIESNSGSIPVLVMVKDANICDYDIGYIKIYRDVGKDESDSIVGDVLLKQVWYDITIANQKYNLYENGDWYDTILLPLSGLDVNNNWYDLSGEEYLHVVFEENDLFDDCNDGDTHLHRRTSVGSYSMPKITNWYGGDTHFHSIYSDNACEFGNPIESTVDAGKIIGLDWVTITDHSFALDSAKWSAIGTEVSTYSDSTFKAIRSEEISAYLPGTNNPSPSCIGDDYKYNHYLAYGANLIPGGECESPSGDTSSDYTPSQLISLVDSQGGFGYVAHPEHSDPFRDTWEDYSLNFAGLEVWNKIIDSSEALDELNVGLNHWVNLLLNNRKVFIAAGTDAHGDFSRTKGEVVSCQVTNFAEGFGESENAFGKVRTVTYSPSGLTESGILNALRNGNSIMTDGPMIAFTVNNEIIGNTVLAYQNSDLNINVVASNTPEFGTDVWFKIYKGVIGEPTEANQYPSDPNSYYYFSSANPSNSLNLNSLINSGTQPFYLRIEAFSNWTGSDFNYRAYTNPIWVNPIDYVTTTSSSTTTTTTTSSTTTTLNSPPNNPSTPIGPSSGYIENLYDFESTTTDPEGDNLYYTFDWGDGSSTRCPTSGYYISGQSCSASHSWSAPGTKYVKVKTTDSNGASSGWSNSKQITIKTPIILNFVSPTKRTVNQNWVFINVTSNKPLSTAILEWNGANITMEPGSWKKNMTDLENGAYSFRVWGRDTAGDWNVTEERTVSVAKGILKYGPTYIQYTKDKEFDIVKEVSVSVQNGSYLNSSVGPYWDFLSYHLSSVTTNGSHITLNYYDSFNSLNKSITVENGTELIWNRAPYRDIIKTNVNVFTDGSNIFFEYFSQDVDDNIFTNYNGGFGGDDVERTAITSSDEGQWSVVDAVVQTSWSLDPNDPLANTLVGIKFDATGDGDVDDADDYVIYNDVKILERKSTELTIKPVLRFGNAEVLVGQSFKIRGVSYTLVKFDAAWDHVILRNDSNSQNITITDGDINVLGYATAVVDDATAFAAREFRLEGNPITILKGNFMALTPFSPKVVLGTYSNSSVTTSANQTTTINASEVNVTLDIYTSQDTNGSVNMTLTSVNQSGTDGLGVPSLGRYLEIDVSPSISGNLTSVMLKMYYADQEVTDAGLVEAYLSMYWWNETSGEWVELNDSMSWVFGTGVNTTANYVWANVSHFSYYALGVPQLPAWVNLSQDWNMFGVPVGIANYSLPTALTSIEGSYDWVFYFNATTDAWQYFNPSMPQFSDLKTLKAGRGYFIQMTSNSTLNFTGTLLTGLTVPLLQDWNMFAPQMGLANYTLPAPLTSIAGSYDWVFYFNATTDAWQYYNPSMPQFSDLQVLEPGRGYFIQMTEGANWTNG